MFDDCGKVENQDHSAISHDRGSAYEVGRDGMVVERFDNKFFFTFERVDNQPELSFRNGDDQDEEFLEKWLRNPTPRSSKRTRGRTSLRSVRNLVVVNLMDFGLEIA